MMESDLVPYVATAVIAAQRVLVLAPHPDDEVFGCGGAIAAHRLHGASVHVIVLTNGDRHGEFAVRAQESEEAARILGYGKPEFWGEKDRQLLSTPALVERLAQAIRTLQVDLVYAPSPWEVHPDHRQSAWAAMQAMDLVQGACRLAFYEVGAPLRPNILLDMTPYVQLKIQAMACFVSQQAYQDYSLKISALNRYRTYSLPETVEAAEAFLLLQANEVSEFRRCQNMVTWNSQPSELVQHQSPPLVSVMIRSTDRPFLQQALDSVAIQTWPNIEVVLIAAVPDHRSPPLQCGHHPIRFFDTTERIGRSAAANKALRHAQGQFLLFLDDDDWLLPSHITRLVSALESQPQVLAAYTGVAFVDSHGTPTGQTFDLPFDLIRQRAGNLTPIQSVLFCASCVDQGLQFDESLDLYEDWDFWLKLAQMTVFSHLPGVSAVYRIHESSGVHSGAMQDNPVVHTLSEAWESRPPISRADLMRKVWSFDNLESLHQKTTTEMQEVSVKLSDISDMAKHMENENHVLSEKLVAANAALLQIKHERDLARDQFEQVDAVLQSLLTSRSWRLTEPLRQLNLKFRRLQALLTRQTFKKIWIKLKSKTVKEIFYLARNQWLHSPVNPYDYSCWLEQQPSHKPSTWPALLKSMEVWAQKPLISVVMPVFNPPLDLLQKAVSSVQKQIYPHWELCIADDASTNPDVWPTLEALAVSDSRLKIVRREKNGHISLATNSAIALASGEFLALMDNDDLLSADALYWVADAINKCPDVNVIYSDEDKLDSKGRHFGPYLKSDWNYTLFLGHNMISHLGVYRSSLVSKVGGFRQGLEGSQDYDLALRCIEQSNPDQIVHIPRVLYHWRAIEGSTALSVEAKPYALQAARRALEEHRERIGRPARIEILPTSNYRLMPAMSSEDHSISVVLMDAVTPAASNSADPAWLAEHGITKIVRCAATAEALNKCIGQLGSEWIVLLRSDLKVTRPDAVSKLLEFSRDDSTGLIGGCVRDSKGRLLSGGLILSPYTIGSVMFSKLAKGHPGYMGRAILAQELSAVSLDCIALRRDSWEAAGGFSAQLSLGRMGAVDFAIRLRALGKKVIWAPESEWQGLEELDFSVQDSDKTGVAFNLLHDTKNLKDSFYHPALNHEAADYSFRRFRRY